MLEMCEIAFRSIGAQRMDSLLESGTMYLYKGTKPTDADAYTSGGSAGGYSGDLLVTYPSASTSYTYHTGTYLVTLATSTDQIASATGTATWFAHEYSQGRTIIGSISDQVAQTGDMWLLDDALVSGNLAIITSFEFIIQSS